MKTLGIVFVIILGIVFLAVIPFIKGFKKGLAKNKQLYPDLLQDLQFKIEYAIVDDHNELYLIRLIKELKHKKEVDQEKLRGLESSFLQRFQVLHECE